MIDDLAQDLIGHNSRDLRSDVLAQMADILDPREERRTKFIRAAGLIVVRDRHEAGQAADWVKLANGFKAIVEEARKAVTDPYDAAHEAGCDRAAVWLAPLEEAIVQVRAIVAKFWDEEQARIDEQQREQSAAEPIVQSAPLPPPIAAKPLPVRGYMGGRVGSTKTLNIKIADVRALPDEIMNSSRVHEAILAVARDFAKHMQTIPGLEIDRGTKAKVG
jgi:hypothetical protein